MSTVLVITLRAWCAWRVEVPEPFQAGAPASLRESGGLSAEIVANFTDYHDGLDIYERCCR